MEASLFIFLISNSVNEIRPFSLWFYSYSQQSKNPHITLYNSDNSVSFNRVDSAVKTMNGIEEKKMYDNFRHEHKSLFAINLRRDISHKYQIMMGDVRKKE